MNLCVFASSFQGSNFTEMSLHIMNCRFRTCHKCSSARGTLWLSVVLFQDDPVLGKAANVWRLITKIALIFTKTWLICDPSKSTPQWIFVDNLDCWVVPRDIVEPKIICKNENNVGLSVELGPPLLLREAGVAQCHQEGDQHSSSQIILLQETHQCCAKSYLSHRRMKCMCN